MIATCSFCSWELDVIGAPDAASRALAAHLNRRHPALAPVTQLPSVVGWAEALEAARALAATGQEFTLADLPDVEHHKTSKGKLAAEIHRLNIAHPVGYRPSTRKATRGSAVKVWHEDRARCMECPRQVVPA